MLNVYTGLHVACITMGLLCVCPFSDGNKRLPATAKIVPLRRLVVYVARERKRSSAWMVSLMSPIGVITAVMPFNTNGPSLWDLKLVISSGISLFFSIMVHKFKFILAFNQPFLPYGFMIIPHLRVNKIERVITRRCAPGIKYHVLPVPNIYPIIIP